MVTMVLNDKKIHQIENDRTKKSPAEIAKYLQDNIGQKVTAYACGLKEPKEVGKWVKGTDPHHDREQKLRCLYHVIRIIMETYDNKTAVAWLFGSNSKFDNNAPAYILRMAKKYEDYKEVVPAALAFAGSLE
jgi:hypothetical protein